MRNTNDRTRERAFTLVEVLVVIAMIGILMALLLPALRGASQTARIAETGSNLRNIGAAILTYIDNNENHLPQKSWDVGGGQQAIIGSLFGGKRGTLPFFGIDQVGSDRRPLNKYLQGTLGPRTDNAGNVIADSEVNVFESPLDLGGPIQGFGSVDSMYDAVGTSYTLNDHCLTGDSFATLVPTQSPNGKPGGRMPNIIDTTRTWVVGEHPIYNYQEGGDRGLRWYDSSDVKTSLWFLDGSVKTNVTVPVDDGAGGPAHTTRDYTFLPFPEWPVN